MNAILEKSLKDLKAQEAKLQAKKDAVRRDAIKEINGMIALLGIKASELSFKGAAVAAPAPVAEVKEKVKKSRRSSGPAKPKYMAPDGTLWSGRGRVKKGIQAALDSGMTLEDMLIKE